MIRRVNRLTQALLPEWLGIASPSLTPPRERGLARRLALLILPGLIFVAALLIGGHFLGVAVDAPLADLLFARLYWPTVFAQVFLSAVVVSRAADVVNDARARRQWDVIRSSGEAVTAFMSAAWEQTLRSTGFMLVSLVILPRLLLGITLLVHQMAFRGEALALLGALSSPPLLFPFDVLALAAGLSATFLLPIQGLATETAFGLWIGSVIRGRTSTTLARFAWIAVRAAGGFGLVVLQLRIISGDISLSSTEFGLDWLLVFTAGALGDWGLASLHVSTLEQLWRGIGWGSLVGVALLGFVILHAGLARLLIRLAMQRAQRSE